MFGGPGGMTGGAAAGAAGAATPHRMGQSLVPNVTISPSAPVSCRPTVLQLRKLTECRSTSHLPARPRPCLATSPLPRLVRSRPSSTASKLLPKTISKASGRQSDNTLRDSTSLTSVSANWRSCRASMRCHRTRGRSFSCRRLINATSSSTSTMLAEI